MGPSQNCSPSGEDFCEHPLRRFQKSGLSWRYHLPGFQYSFCPYCFESCVTRFRCDHPYFHNLASIYWDAFISRFVLFLFRSVVASTVGILCYGSMDIGQTLFLAILYPLTCVSVFKPMRPQSNLSPHPPFPPDELSSHQFMNHFTLELNGWKVLKRFTITSRVVMGQNQ